MAAEDFSNTGGGGTGTGGGPGGPGTSKEDREREERERERDDDRERERERDEDQTTTSGTPSPGDRITVTVNGRPVSITVTQVNAATGTVAGIRDDRRPGEPGFVTQVNSVDLMRSGFTPPGDGGGAGGPGQVGDPITAGQILASLANGGITPQVAINALVNLGGSWNITTATNTINAIVGDGVQGPLEDPGLVGGQVPGAVQVPGGAFASGTGFEDVFGGQAALDANFTDFINREFGQGGGIGRSFAERQQGNLERRFFLSQLSQSARPSGFVSGDQPGGSFEDYLSRVEGGGEGLFSPTQARGTFKDLGNILNTGGANLQGTALGSFNQLFEIGGTPLQQFDAQKGLAQSLFGRTVPFEFRGGLQTALNRDIDRRFAGIDPDNPDINLFRQIALDPRFSSFLNS